MLQTYLTFGSTQHIMDSLVEAHGAVVTRSVMAVVLGVVLVIDPGTEGMTDVIS